MDLDIEHGKSRQLTPDLLASYKAAGMDKVATVLPPRQKISAGDLPISPRLRSSCPCSKEEAADIDRKFRSTGRD